MNENSKSVNADNDDESKNACASVYETIVSDDDSASANKTLMTNHHPPSCPPADIRTTAMDMDQSSDSGSDDESVIESDQPLYLDGVPSVNTTNTSSDNEDLALGCEHDGMIADFLNETFDSNVEGSKNRGSSTFDGVLMDAKVMDALLDEENEPFMLFPDLGVGV